MIDSLAEGIVLACSPALACAGLAAAQRVRARRRRDLLNSALHELRRPLQALVLQATGSPGAASGRDQLALALDALADLDRTVNGGPAPRAWTIADGHALAVDAASRWQGPAAVEGRQLALAWRANGSRLHCDPAAISRALDNLIANSLEHGSGPIRIEGSERSGRLRLTIADGTAAGGEPGDRGPANALRSGTGRGHGLRIVSQVAAAHGGRFAACSHPGGASAVLELPLASPAPTRDVA